MQPTLTQVPPSAASSATATRAPRCAASRPRRTPPLPAPMTKRSKSPAVLIASRRRSLQRLLQQLGHEAVDAVGAIGALLAQRRRERRRQLARERHQASGSVEATLLAPIGDLRCALRKAARDPRRLHLPADLASEELVEIGLLHAHERPATWCETVIVACCGTVGRWPSKRPSARRRCSSPTSIVRSTATAR